MPTSWAARLLLSSSPSSALPYHRPSQPDTTSSLASPVSQISLPSYSHSRNDPGAQPSHSRSKSYQIPANTPPASSQARPGVRRPLTLALRRSEGDLLAAAEVDAVRRLGAGAGAASSGRTLPGMMSNPHRAVELTTGQCMCCDSTVRWPSNLTQFRCTICMTINDLKFAKITASSPADASSRKPPPPISIYTVKNIIDVSVEEFIANQEFQAPLVSTDERLLGPLYDDTLGEDRRMRASVPELVPEDPTLPPSRPPPPPPAYSNTEDKGFSSHPEDVAAARIKSRAAKLFKPLENYLRVAFSSWECLNSSFVENPGPDASNSNIKPQDEVIQPPRDVNDDLIPVTEKPGEKEALMLTVGRAVRRERANSRNERGYRSHESRPSPRAPPGIDWDLAKEFYDLVLNAGNDVLVNYDASEYHDDPWTDIERQIEVEYAIEEARIDMLKALLKTTENILKRPGRPLRRPEDIRFLLIIIANPLLYPGAARLTSRRPSAIPASSEVQSGARRLPNRMISPSGKNAIMGGPGCHSGLLKRVFGLLSRLPNECHHFLITWFSIMPESHFRRLVELGGSFTTYRITRQDNRMPSRNSGGLRGKLPYSDDWQIKATARVMSLLDKANNNSLGRRRHTRSTGENSDISLIWKQDAYRRGQIIPGSSFYNMRLDYCDLIADFDVWESKVAKFCFCQYPFYLSMGAKIQILEHDARRQMEIQARNAFITNISNRTTLSQYMVLKVRRECLVEDSLKGISEGVGAIDDIKKGLRVEFVGEDGIDAGGLKKEWFLMVAREVFDPNHGLFVYDEDSRYCYFNPYSFESSEEFYLVGVLLGLAIYNSTILDVTLPPYVFRKLIYFAPQYTKGGIDARPRASFRRSLEDLAVLRPALAVGLQKLLDFEGDVQETFCRDFVAETERYGKTVVTPLCPNGENRPVTGSNRKEFVDLYLKHILDTSVSRQFEPFKRGFYMVCGGNALSLFGPEEIELLVRGSAEPLDVHALKAVAIYDGWGSNDPPESDTVVKWFWSFFERISPKEQRMLLSFITGSDRIPAMGATSLIIKVVCLGEDSDRFPVARTCFNQICLWRYRRREKLERMVWRAVTESEGFGLK